MVTPVQNLDAFADWAAGYAALSGIAHRSFPFVARRLGPTNRLVRWMGLWGRFTAFKWSGALGVGAMGWHGLRAVRRLLTSDHQSEEQKFQDRMLVAGAALAVANVGLGLFRRGLTARLVAGGFAFVEQTLAPITHLQNLLIVAGVGLDAFSSAHLVQNWSERPSGQTALEVGFQLLLTGVFSWDRQSRHAFKALWAKETEVGRLGCEVANVIRQIRPGGTDAIGRDPFSIGAMILHQLGLPQSHTFRLAEFYRGRSEGDFETEDLVRRMLGGGLDVRLNNDQGRLEQLPLDQLLESIVLHSRRGARVRQSDLRQAQAMVLSGQFQKKVIEEFYPQARGKRVGPEVECDPPRHADKSWAVAESVRRIEEKRPLTREEMSLKFQQALQAKGWSDVRLVDAEKRLTLGKEAKVYPELYVAFDYEGKRYFFHSYQGTGNNIVNARIGGQHLKVIGLQHGRVSDEPQNVLDRFRHNYELTMRRFAETAASRSGDRKSANQVLGEMKEILQSQGGPSYRINCIKTAEGTLQHWSYVPGTDGRGRILLETITTAEGRRELAGSYASHEEAYLALRQMVEEKALRIREVDRHLGVTATKGGRTLSAGITVESDIDIEMTVDGMKAGALDDEFLEIITETLATNGARGTVNGHLVAHQTHYEVPHFRVPTGRQSEAAAFRAVEKGLNMTPLVRINRGFYRFSPLVEAGMPPSPSRADFIVKPEVPFEHCHIEDQRRRIGLALQEMLGQDWELRAGESSLGRFLRIHERVKWLTKDHYGVLNLDNWFKWQLAQAEEASRGFKEVRGRRMARKLQEALRSARSTRINPIPTVEVRLNDPAQERRGDELFLSPAGTLWNHRFWTSFLYAAEKGSLENRPAPNWLGRFQAAAAEMLREQYGVTVAT